MSKSMYELLSRAPFIVVGVCLRAQKQNHSNIAGRALEPDSSSMLEIYVGFRAGGLRWCIAVRTLLLYQYMLLRWCIAVRTLLLYMLS